MPRISICSLIYHKYAVFSLKGACSTLSESFGLYNESPDAAAGVMATESRDQTLPLVSRLGPCEREHHDLALTEACDVDFVAIHEDCSGLLFQTDANLLQDVA